MNPSLARAGRRLVLVALPLLLAGCAALSPQDRPRVEVVGIEPLGGQGLELRLAVKLRILNPSDVALQYDGVFLEMDVRGKRFASGVSDAQGSVPRFGETVLSVPVSVTTLAVLRQALDIASGSSSPKLDYQLRGKLAGPVFRSHAFESEGELELPARWTGPAGTPAR